MSATDAVESNIRENELINAQLSADAAWERAQQLEAEVVRLRDEVAEHRKRSMRQYYGCQGFMAIKQIVDRYNAFERKIDGDAHETMGRIYATVLEHKANMDRTDAK